MEGQVELTPQKFVCMTCGSENVVAAVTVVWDVEVQDWRIDSTTASPGEDFCNYCADFSDCHHVPMDFKDYAVAAIKKAEGQ